MNLHDELGRVNIFNEDVHGTVQYLCDRGLLATDKTCSKCGAEMRIGLREDLSDKKNGCRILYTEYFCVKYTTPEGGGVSLSLHDPHNSVEISS